MPKKKTKKIGATHRGSPMSRGSVVAYDYKYTGEEPHWSDVNQLSDEQFMARRTQALQFYNYYLNHKYLLDDMLHWLKENGYSKSDIRKIKNLPDHAISFTHKKLMRCMNMGMPGDHKSYQKKNSVKSDIKLVKKAISTALVSAVDPGESEPTETASDKPSPFQLMIDKTNREIVSRLDEMLDEWILAGDTKVKAIDLLPLLIAGKVKGAALQVVIDWIEPQLNELVAAYDKTDDQAVEGYSHLSKNSIKSRINQLKKLLTDCENQKEMAKTERKSKAKKTPSIAKQIANVKYLKHDMELGVASLSPTVLPGTRFALLYNTKTKSAVFLASNVDGFSVKGTTIQNVDDSESFQIKIRKPLETIKDLQKCTTSSKVKETLNELTTKPSKTNCRMNDQTIILKSW